MSNPVFRGSQFLNRIVTHILAFKGDSQVVRFEGNHAAYAEDLKRCNGSPAAQPERISYKSRDR